MDLPIAENTEQAVLADEQVVSEVKAPPKMPAPSATGNQSVAILKHNLRDVDMAPDGSHRFQAGLELAIRNVSDTTIATAAFHAVLYDEEGNVVDTLEHREIDLKPDRSRGVHIAYPQYEYEKVKSYDLRIVRTTTADFEKVQLRRHEAKTTETGEEEIVGILKNISSVKTDAAVVASFYDAGMETLGTRVLVVRDIEPDALRQFVCRFRPLEGDMVMTYALHIGEVVG